jgi:hypothetical protein
LDDSTEGELPWTSNVEKSRWSEEGGANLGVYFVEGLGLGGEAAEDFLGALVEKLDKPGNSLSDAKLALEKGDKRAGSGRGFWFNRV